MHNLALHCIKKCGVIASPIIGTTCTRLVFWGVKGPRSSKCRTLPRIFEACKISHFYVLKLDGYAISLDGRYRPWWWCNVSDQVSQPTPPRLPQRTKNNVRQSYMCTHEEGLRCLDTRMNVYSHSCIQFTVEEGSPCIQIIS